MSVYSYSTTEIILSFKKLTVLSKNGNLRLRLINSFAVYFSELFRICFALKSRFYQSKLMF